MIACVTMWTLPLLVGVLFSVSVPVVSWSIGYPVEMRHFRLFLSTFVAPVVAGTEGILAVLWLMGLSCT